MADLLIRGASLPKDTPNGYKTLLLWYDGEITGRDGNTIARAVELPDHGRCIDADAFAAKYVAALPDALANLNDQKNIPMMTAIIQALLLDIAEADTIIPASKEGGE